MAKRINIAGHTYEVMSPKTDRARSIKNAFEWSSDFTLRDVYGRYSQAKENAYAYCRSREAEANSVDGCITGANTCQFSYAFTCEWEGIRYLIYITKNHDYAIEYNAIQ